MLIALRDGPEFVGALFGILKLGAVVVMVNPDLGAEKLAALFDYSRAGAAVVDGGGAASGRPDRWASQCGVGCPRTSKSVLHIVSLD